MSKLDCMQLTSLHFQPKALFTSFQQLGNTTSFPSLIANQAKPTLQLGDASHNPMGVIDNTQVRATYMLLMFACKAANNANLKFDVIGYAKTTQTATPIYLPITFFSGVAQAGNIDISTAVADTTCFLCDNFPTKTFVGTNTTYIEPTDDIGGAVLIMDIRGVEYVGIRLAQGVSVAATYGQVFYGFN